MLLGNDQEASLKIAEAKNNFEQAKHLKKQLNVESKINTQIQN
jgi:hypothetical protein